ncbi:MAG: hypothetical protein IPF55_07745 [Rhodoferax sp.]|nr:hypothetical protein [Rhodoferax sp.]
MPSPEGRAAVTGTKRSLAQRLAGTEGNAALCKAKRVAVAGVRHNCHEHGFQAEPQATADPARCGSEPRPYLRTSALTNTCEALVMYLPGTCAGRTSAARTD